MTLQSPSRTRTFYLDLARAFAIFSITWNHAVNRAYDNYINQMAEFVEYSTMSSIIKATVSVFSRLGVPIFLMITGVLILNKPLDTSDRLKRYYKHNVLGVLLTTLIWYLIMFWFVLQHDPTNTILEKKTTLEILDRMFQTLLFQNQVTLGSMWYMPMILCLYTLLPLLWAAKEKLPAWVLWIPMGMTIVNSMVIPAFNNYEALTDGTHKLNSILHDYNMVPMYLMYIFVGYCIGGEKLRRIPTWLVGLLAFGTFGLCCYYQYFAYSKPENYLVTYNSPGILVCTAFLFEWFRRRAEWLRWLQKPVTYLSKISFGIYFVHIILMEYMDWYKGLELRPLQRMLWLEIGAFAGSIVIIWLLCWIKPLKRCLFMVKD